MLVIMRLVQRTFWVQHQPRVQSKSTVSTAAYSFLYCFHWSFSIVIPEMGLPHLVAYLLYCSQLSSVILIIPHLSRDKRTTSLGQNVYRTILILCVPCIVQKFVYVTLHAPEYTHQTLVNLLHFQVCPQVPSSGIFSVTNTAPSKCSVVQ